MKCPECVAEGKRSVVTPHATFTTAMPVDQFYDEDGEAHYHDPNRHSTNYSCSNGHTFGESHLMKCGACDFGTEG